MFFTTLKAARESAIEEARYGEDCWGVAYANLRGGGSAVVRAKRGPSGRVRCTVERDAGHFTDEPPTGGLADQIRDARKDVYGY